MYRSKYLEHYDTPEQLHLFDDSHFSDESHWREIQKYLTDTRINTALDGIRPAGYFGTSVTNVLSVELDDHYAGGWIDSTTPTNVLKNKYTEVVKRLSLPSFAVRSPRGIHLYWILQERLPALIIQDIAKRKIGNLGEVRPTMNAGLRLPELGKIIDPQTFQPVKVDFKKIEYIHPAILFDDQYTADYIKAEFKDFKKSRLRYQTNKLVELEWKYLPVMGSTNDSLCILGALYKGAGLTLNEACERFKNLLAITGYTGGTGELNNAKRLEMRLASVYKNVRDFTGSFETLKKEVQPSLFDQVLIDTLTINSPYVAQRMNPLRYFLQGVMQWVNYHDEILRDPAQLALWSYLYPYYKVNVSRGFYPMPSTLLRKLNFRYFKFLPYLTESGFLTPAPFNYSSRLGVCKHYKVEKNVQFLIPSMPKKGRSATTYY